MDLDHFFSFSDKDHSGYITLPEFKRTLLPFGDAGLLDKEVEALFALLDKDRSGRLTHGEVELGLQGFNISHILSKAYELLRISGMSLHEIFKTYSVNQEYLKPESLANIISELA